MADRRPWGSLFPGLAALAFLAACSQAYQETTDPLGSEGKTTLLILKVDAANP